MLAPLSRIIDDKLDCPICKIRVRMSGEKLAPNKYRKVALVKLDCGHAVIEEVLHEEDVLPFTQILSRDGRSLMKFQETGVEFAERANARCLIADEMGLGKTIQALALIARNPKDLTPFVVCCKAGLVHQWLGEIVRWLGPSYIPQVIDNGNAKPVNGFKSYIVSLDLLRNLKWLDEFKPKFIIIDEVQLIKNPESQRTKAVARLANDIKHAVGLSGTPIKNHAGEYYPILHILDPGRFRNYSQFIWEWCDAYNNGYGTKVGGIKRHRLQAWQDYTKDLIIRRTVDEVLPDLPKVRRNFQLRDLEQDTGKMYARGFAEFESAMLEYEYGAEGKSKFDSFGNVLAQMTKLRHLTGVAKVGPVVEFVEEFLEQTDKQIVIFVHHIDVGDLVQMNLKTICERMEIAPPLRIEGGMDKDTRNDIDVAFREGKSRIMVASTLAAGEGLNWQHCHDAIMMERQWNPANEEQAEGRFRRIGSEATFIAMTYLVAVGTIDEMFSEIVEKKRAICRQTMNNEDIKWNESDLMKELANALLKKGRPKWSLK